MQDFEKQIEDNNLHDALYKAIVMGANDDELQGILSNHFEKGAKANIGEIRVWRGGRYKKQANGKWVEVSEHGMSKREHESKSEYYHGKGSSHVNENNSNRGSLGAKMNFEASKYNKEQASKLSDKEYSDEEMSEK